MPIKPLPRRKFIKGVGVTLALPFLEAMLPVNRSWAAAPVRFASLYQGNGMLCGRGGGEDDYWSSVGSATGITTYSAPLQNLAAYKDYLTVVQNCSFGNIQESGDAGHEQAAPSFLTGQNVATDAGVLPPTAHDRDVSRLAAAGMSIDRMIAAKQTTSLKSLMMAVAGANGNFVNVDPKIQMMANVSWDSQTAHLTDQVIRNTADVFKRLTSSGLSTTPGGGGTPTPSPAPSPSNATIIYNQKKSVIDSVLTEINSLMLRLGNSDKQILSQYLDSLRTIETDLQSTLPPTTTPPPTTGACTIPSLDIQNIYKANTITNYSNITKTAQQMIDLMALAFSCGITNVSTLMLSYDWSTVPGDQFNAAYGANNIDKNYHNSSHYVGDGATTGGLQAHQTIENWHAAQVAYLAKVFKATADSDGKSLLDNSLVLFGSGMGDPNDHLFSRMVKVLLGRGAGLNPGANGKIINAGGGGNAHPRLLQTILAGFGITTTVGQSNGQNIAGIIG